MVFGLTHVAATEPAAAAGAAMELATDAELTSFMFAEQKQASKQKTEVLQG